MSGLFGCTFCDRAFTRHDALKRHWTTCKLRQSRALDVPRVQLKQRGRKAKACDRCSRLKRACTSTKPCSTCTRHQKMCTYSRVHHEERCGYLGEDATASGPNADDPDWGFLDEPATISPPEDMLLPWQWQNGTSDCNMNGGNFVLKLTGQMRPSERSLRPTSLDIISLKRFPFLLRVADNIGIANTFECGTIEQRTKVVCTQQTRVTNRVLGTFQQYWQERWNTPGIDLPDLPLEINDILNQPEPFDLLADLDPVGSPYWWTPLDYPATQESASSAGMVASCLDEESSRYMSRTHEIVAHLRELVMTKHRPTIISLSWSESIEAMCYEFFHPDNLRKFLDLFWTFWKPNWPAIHKATFDIGAASSSLLAAIVLLGASLSPDGRDRAMTHLWFNPVEQLVFDDDVFSLDLGVAWDDPGSMALCRSQLEILQAAYCVALYQTWEGCRESRQRVRRFRYSAIISLARDIGLSSASLRTIDTSSVTTFDWKEFILRESLIRVCHYIFALDSGYALFYRHPPRMVLSELVMDLASPESCFQAQSAEECFVALRVWREGLGDSQTITVSSTLAAICTGQPTPETLRLFSKLSVLNMFTLVSALYTMSFKLETSMVCVEEVARIQAGLETWKNLWPSPDRDAELIEMYACGNHREQKVGFIRYAPEYWLLTRLILESLYGREHPEEMNCVVKCEDTDMEHLQSLLRSFSM